MANPTTNFGWVMPTSTSLVTNLPADFNTFGQGVDTSMAQLKGGTTGQILSKTSATDMAFTWITPNPGDITGVTAGTGISGGGTSGDVTITNSMATAMTTKGDLVPATGSGTFSRLAVGANNTVLTADSSTATGLKWATASSGGMTSIASGTHSGATLTLSSISSSYKNLILYITNYKPVDAVGLLMQFNGDSTANRHATFAYSINTANLGFTGTNCSISNDASTSTGTQQIIIEIPNYANTTIMKTAIVDALTNGTTAGAVTYRRNLACYNQTGAVSSLVFTDAYATSFDANYTLYGVS